MIISHKKRFVMFQPWKTASQTMGRRLHAYNESSYDRFFSFNPYLRRVVHQHMTCSDFVCLPESDCGYYTASFIRNPYDRVYSGFWQFQKDIKTHPKATYANDWTRSLVIRQLDENLAYLRRANFDFEEWISALDEALVYEIGRNICFHLHPAHYWTHLGPDQYVDFIGRVESFESDFKEFCLRVEIDTPVVNVNLIGLSGHSDMNPFGYRYISRMSAASISKINSLFADDFELFGYTKIV